MSDRPAVSDAELLEGLRRSDPLAQAAFVRRYVERLAELASQRFGSAAHLIDIDVAVGSVCRTVLRRAAEDEIDGLAGDSLWPLLLTILLRKCLNQRRAATAGRRGGGQVAALPDEVADTGPTAGALAEMADGLRVAADRLTDRRRMIVEMRLAGEKDEEIAARLGVTVRTIQRESAKILAVFREVFPEAGEP